MVENLLVAVGGTACDHVQAKTCCLNSLYALLDVSYTAVSRDTSSTWVSYYHQGWFCAVSSYNMHEYLWASVLHGQEVQTLAVFTEDRGYVMQRPCYIPTTILYHLICIHGIYNVAIYHKMFILVLCQGWLVYSQRHVVLLNKMCSYSTRYTFGRGGNFY